MPAALLGPCYVSHLVIVLQLGTDIGVQHHKLHLHIISPAHASTHNFVPEQSGHTCFGSTSSLEDQHWPLFKRVYIELHASQGTHLNGCQMPPTSSWMSRPNWRSSVTRYQSGCSCLPAWLWCRLVTRSTPRSWKAQRVTSLQNALLPALLHLLPSNNKVLAGCTIAGAGNAEQIHRWDVPRQQRSMQS